MSKNSGRNWAIGALVAGTAGYIAGILTAPKSGKETRKDIQKAAVKAKREAEIKLKMLHAELDVLIVKAKALAVNAKAGSKEGLDAALKAADKAKAKAREMLSAVHEGDASDEDLQAAIADVKSSITHLKSFLKNNGTSKEA